jgi:hypothetical protein
MSTPASAAAVELNRARWSRTTPEERAAFARRMRLGIVVKELGRHDLDPAMRERIVTAMAPAGDLGPGECERCQAQVQHRFHDAEVEIVCAVCLGGGRDAA